MRDTTPEVLVYLRERFNRIDAADEWATNKLDDIARRLTLIELETNQWRTAMTLYYGSMTLQLDRFGRRMDCVERKLGISEPVE